MGRYFKRLLQILVISFIVIYLLVWLLSPTIIRYVINTYGLPKPLLLTDTSSIRYNPFTAHLTISDLEVKTHEQASALKLQSLNAEVHLYQLFFDKIYVAEFTLNGIFIPVTVNESSLNIAGFELMSENPVPVEAEPEVEPEGTNFPYQVIVPEFSLTDAHIELLYFSQKHNIQLDSFFLQNILLSQNVQDIKLNLVSHLNGAPIEIAIDGSLLKQQGEISVELNAKNIELIAAKAFLPPTILSLEGKVSYASKFNIAINEAETLININKLILTVEDLLVNQEGLALSVKKQNIEIQNTKSLLPVTSALNADDKVKKADKNNITLSKEQTSVNINDLLVSVEGLHVEQNNIAIDINSQKVQANNLAVLLPANNPISVDAILDVTVDGIAAKSIETEAILAEIATLSVNHIVLQYQQDIAKVNIESVDVAKSQFSKNIQQNMPALAAFNGLSVNNIEYTPELIAINDISLSGLVANVLLDKDKQLSTLVALASPDDIKSNATEQDSNNTEQDSTVLDKELTVPAVVTEEASKPAKQVFRIGKFTLLDDAQIDFKDSSVNPHYERNVNITHLLLSDIDTGKPEQEVILDIQGKSDTYANFDIKGRGVPFAEQQKFKLNAVIKELSLPGVSSYIKQALKYEIESGQLDLTIAAGLTGNKINGDVDILLRGVEFTAADDNERGAISDGFSVPFNVALGMLKDSDGNVELSLPLKGDTNSPSFGLSGLLTLLVKQATMSAAKDYLITTFVPYASVMKVAMAAGEFALKLRINDLVYPATATELNAEQLEFSRQMSVMLADRGNINVKLCAVATASDIELEDAEQAHLPENIARLSKISQQRVDLFKAHLVEQLKVPSARLLFCKPQIDTSKGAKSRIKFVI
ncbi:DUF748 domain-containing protein [Cognaticolwellia beringensis]|uniref:DUF748 domain-containing protein n=1 Tax=Cognaticolwellia beringensis TaxID=1967665 RepID=A0A222GCL1_9GAMM|nr:DUF748 domain-containing protein [Cognaticolwellia beringensis]ASP49609.1 DUF748 domain-containing protein [Cognaticolwellia beringensis]